MTGGTAETRTATMVWVAIGVGVVFFVLAVAFASRLGVDPSISSSPLVGKPAPTTDLELMDGSGTVNMSDFEGDVRVVNFWASWCLGCRTEHAALLQGASAYESFGVTFIAVNYQDSPGNAEAFLDELGRSSVTVYTVDNDSRTAFGYGVLGLPETFFIDRDGIVVGKVSGPLTYALLSATIDQILLGNTVGEIETGEVENR